MHIQTVAIGDELLTGRISDSNSTYVSGQLFARGFRLQAVSVIPDNFEEIENTFRRVAETDGVVIVFGGLGPTSDDLTAEAVTRLAGGSLVQHEPSYHRLVDFYNKRQREVTPAALKQVLVPSIAQVYLNEVGMAPAFSFRFEKAVFYCLPGVPREMKWLFEKYVLPAILPNESEILTRTWACLGIWESDLQKQMNVIEASLPKGAWLGYRTRFPENHLTLYCRKGLGVEVFASWENRIREVLKPWAYTEESRELEDLILGLLESRKETVSFAESCTGGLAAQRLSRIPGASLALWGGVQTYQLAAKKEMLGLDIATEDLAVSEATALAMAQSIQFKSSAAWSAAVTGFLGPTGGSTEKPPVTVFCSVVGPRGYSAVKRFQFPVRPREESQWGASTYLLHMIYEALKLNSRTLK